MKMPGEGDADVEKTIENGEASSVEAGESNTPFKHKYRELKGRLKCLVYVSVLVCMYSSFCLSIHVCYLCRSVSVLNQSYKSHRAGYLS